MENRWKYLYYGAWRWLFLEGFQNVIEVYHRWYYWWSRSVPQLLHLCVGALHLKLDILPWWSRFLIFPILSVHGFRKSIKPKTCEGTADETPVWCRVWSIELWFRNLELVFHNVRLLSFTKCVSNPDKQNSHLLLSVYHCSIFLYEFQMALQIIFTLLHHMLGEQCTRRVQSDWRWSGTSELEKLV